MKRTFFTFISMTLLTVYLMSCASKKTFGREEYDQNSTARGPAYVGDGMTVRTPMISRPDWRPIPFYYKHCHDSGQRFYYSKTAYDCTTP